jgi:lysophospholipase L1-like esterase
MRVRLLAVLGAAALMVLTALPASAGEEQGDHDGDYLALGDSVPFGLNPTIANKKNADVFTGYPEIVAKRLNLEDSNATCPGEASGGFLSLTGTDNLCRPYRFVLKNRLHVRYAGTQMDYALHYLRTHEETKLVTLTLGANDVFRWQKDCATAGGPSGTCAPDPVTSFPRMLATLQANLTTILQKIRATGYRGLIVGVTYYSLTYPVTTGADTLNSTMQAALKAPGVHGHEASGVEAWRSTAMSQGGGSPCMAGLLIRLSPGPAGCDVHPAPPGRDLLADAVLATIAGTCSAGAARSCLEAQQQEGEN